MVICAYFFLRTVFKLRISEISDGLKKKMVTHMVCTLGNEFKRWIKKLEFYKKKEFR